MNLIAHAKMFLSRSPTSEISRKGSLIPGLSLSPLDEYGHHRSNDDHHRNHERPELRDQRDQVGRQDRDEPQVALGRIIVADERESSFILATCGTVDSYDCR